jgi:hypothetical protein
MLTHPTVTPDIHFLFISSCSLLHASFRHSLTVVPLRFTRPSPPSGWSGNSHPQVIVHGPARMKLLGAKLRGIFAKFSEALPTLLRQGYGGFSSPSSSQHPPKDGSAVAEAARYSAKENKIPRGADPTVLPWPVLQEQGKALCHRAAWALPSAAERLMSSIGRDQWTPLRKRSGALYSREALPSRPA